jgi:F-type H+-transporting ATPase subunit b
MLIDWFTVIAQLINFLVLVWLLKRFLYHPILDAIDAREKRIADELADADEKRAEAELQRDAFQQKNAAFDKHSATNMAKVIAEAKTEKTRLLDLARQEVDVLRSKLELALKQEQLSLQESLSHRAQDEVFLIVRKALNDLAETSLESSMVIVFVQRINNLKDEEKANLKSAFKDFDQPLIVQTAFDLPKEQSALVKSTLKAIVGDSVDIQFAIEPKLISGIEINANGQKIAWSIADYLTTLTKHVNQVLESRDKDQINNQQVDTQDLDNSSRKDQNKEIAS